MFDMPPTIVLGLVSIVALALFLFFWRAVSELTLPTKIAARVLLAVFLILPLGLAWYGFQSDLYQTVETAKPTAPTAPKKHTKTKRRAHADKDRDREHGGLEEFKRAARPTPPAGANGGSSEPEPRAPRSRSPDRSLEILDDETATSGQPGKPTSPPVTAPTGLAPGAGSGASPPPAAGASPGAGPLTTTEKPNPDWTVVPIFFGTDRQQEPDTKRLTYGWKRAKRLALGLAHVTIPNDHVIPKVERPWALRIPYLDITIYEETEDPAKHFTMSEIKELPREQFLALVREKIAKASRFNDHALVFIHGYNNKFDNAAFRTAQIAHDLKFDSAPFLYSWPSSGTLLGYTSDRESSSQAEPYLREFLNLVVNETGAKKVSIIAHSMGNQLLLRVLQDLKRSKPDEVVISQLILAAPDVDRDSFENILKSIKGIAEGITLYTAANDAALQASRQFAGGIARAGDVPDEGPLVIEGVDTIDATATSLDSVGINHSTYAENNALLTDIGKLILTGQRPPSARVPTLERVPTQAGDYWRYPQPTP